MNTATYLVTCQQPDGLRVIRIVRVIGKATTDDVAAMVAAHDLIPRDIIRAPTGASLDTITRAIADPYQVMYMQGK